MTDDSTLIVGSSFPCLVVEVDGQLVKTVSLKDELGIGRAKDNDLELTDPKVSRHHARIDRQGDTYVLTDLGSANGTLIGGVRLTSPHSLRHGEKFTVGDSELLFQERDPTFADTITAPVIAAVPRPTVPAPAGAPPATQDSEGASRGLVLGLIVIAAILLLALSGVFLYVFAPGVLEGIGLLPQPAPTAAVVSPTSTEPARSPTPTDEPLTTSEGTPVGSVLSSTEFNDLLAQADALTRRSKFEEATAIYEHLAEQEPTDPRTHVGWAWMLIYDKDIDGALDHARLAVELSPNSAEAKAVLARALVDAGDADQAVGHAEEAVQFDPGSAEAHAVLAEAYTLSGEEQLAVDEADLALVQDSQNANAHRIRGWLYHLVDNNMGRAAGELQSAAGLQPELWLRRHELGMLLLEAENYSTAIIAFQDALAIRPKAVTYTAIGDAYYRLAQYDQAKASLQQAFAAGAEDAHTHGLLAATYAHQDRCDAAQPHYEQALALDPDHPQALEAVEMCQEAEASPTTGSTSEPAEASTPETTAAPTRRPASLPALNGQIAFPVWNAEGGKYDTYIAQANDGSERQLVVEEMHQPALSPDGQWLAVNGERHEHMDLFIVKPDGTQLTAITRFVEDGQPDWSPDSRKLAFASSRHGDKEYRIYLIDEVPFGGGRVEGRTLNNGADDVRGQLPAWTSDGRIVFRGCHPDSPRTACDGTGLYIVTAEPGPHSPEKLTDHGEDTAPAAHGDKIAFMSNRDGDWDIYVMNMDGTDLERLTDNEAHDGLPTWSADGETIAFVSNEGGPWAIWAMNADGSSRGKLFDVGGGGLAYDWQHERIGWGP
jgi:tetratricopeptide (TPR) repeat protein